MKSLNVFLDEKKKHNKDNIDPPALLTLKRKYVRFIAPGIKVAVYHSEQLNKLITVPLDDVQFSESIEEQGLLLREDNISALEQIVDSGKSANLTFDDGTNMVVDSDTANNILSVYARANVGNKKRIAEFVNSDIKQFQDFIKFCLQNS